VGTPPDWSRATRTDHSGHFLLTDVPRGEHVVNARHGALLATSETRIRVVEGAETPGAVIRLPAVVEEEPEAQESARAAPTQPSGPLSFAMRGAVVILENVASESLAARAGLQKGDVLLSVDGEPVRSAAQARGMLGVGIGRRTSWTLHVRRDQKTLVLRYPPR
jgi:membrane-associated protease RseP (regulator of RpoE activity)